VPVLERILKTEQNQDVRSRVDTALYKITLPIPPPAPEDGAGLEELSRRGFLQGGLAALAAASAPARPLSLNAADGDTTAQALTRQLEAFFGARETQALLLPAPLSVENFFPNAGYLADFLATTETEWIADISNLYTQRTGKPVPAEWVGELKKAFRWMRDPAIPSAQALLQFDQLLSSPLGEVYAIAIRLGNDYTVSSHGLEARRMRYVTQRFAETPALRTWLQQAHPDVLRDMQTALPYLNGKRSATEAVRAALRRMGQQSPQFATEDEQYLSRYRQARQELARRLGEQFSNFTPFLKHWLDRHQVRIVDELTPEERPALPAYLGMLQTVLAGLPEARSRGLTVRLHSGNDRFERAEQRYVRDDDLMLLAPHKLMEYYYPLDPTRSPLSHMRGIATHEIIHRWDFRLIPNDQRAEFFAISWHPASIFQREASKVSGFFDSPREDVNWERDIVMGLREPGSLSALYAPEDVARIGEELVANHNVLVRSAIRNLLQHQDPDLAQKIFFLYHFFGRVLSSDLWIVRAEQRLLADDDGVYIFRDGSRQEKIVLERGRVTKEPLREPVDPSIHLRAQWMKAGLEEGVVLGAGLEEVRLEATGILVVGPGAIETPAGLEEFAKGLPSKLAARVVVYVVVPALAARLEELNPQLRVVSRFEDLVVTLLADQKAERFSVWDKTMTLTHQLRQAVPQSMTVTHLEQGIALKAILGAMGVPEAVLDRINTEVLGQWWQRLRAA